MRAVPVLHHRLRYRIWHLHHPRRYDEPGNIIKDRHKRREGERDRKREREEQSEKIIILYCSLLLFSLCRHTKLEIR